MCPHRFGYYKVTQLPSSAQQQHAQFVQYPNVNYVTFLISNRNSHQNSAQSTTKDQSIPTATVDPDAALNSIKQMCMTLIADEEPANTTIASRSDTRNTPNPHKNSFRNIDDLSSWFTKHMIGELSTLIGKATIRSGDAHETTRVTIVSNMYMILSMFVATLKVTGFNFNISHYITGSSSTGNVVDLVYKGMMTLCAMGVTVNTAGVLLTLPEHGFFSDPMSLPECYGAYGGGVDGCNIYKYDGFYKNMSTGEINADDYIQWLQCVHDLAMYKMNVLMNGLAVL